MDFLKKYGAYLLIGFAIICGFLTAIIDSETTTTQKTQTNYSNPEYEVKIAPELVVQNFKEGVLNKGYNIKGNIYYTRSKDYAKVYMFGALVEKRGDIYNCVWANNEKDSTGVFESINDYAIQVSGIPRSGHMSTLDDGYSRVNQKLLDDWSNY